MKFITIFLLLGIINVCFAQSVDITVDPKMPIVGDTFNVEFAVKSKVGDSPSISFNPRGVEVVSKSRQGITTRTTYINGRLTVTREISVIYQMVANNASGGYLRDIQVNIGGNTIKHPTVRIQVLRQAQKNRDIFAIAVPSKNELYVNESVLVRYYLYYKVRTSQPEIKEFPKLKKVLKRFHDEQRAIERVEYKGDIYQRRLVYSQQLFPEKAGTIRLDPIKLNVKYSVPRRNNYFGGIGFNDVKQKQIMSKAIQLNVKKLPVEGVPAHFTGLVGKHDFKLEINKKKFLVNEPIEIKLKVSGPGALETFEEPKIFENDVLEEFETNSDLTLSKDFTATKIFDYTYLARAGTVEPAKKIQLSYFDPEKEKFVTQEIDFSGFKVIGSVSPNYQSNEPNRPKDESNASPQISNNMTIKLIGPTTSGIKNKILNYKNIIILLLVILIIMILKLLKSNFGITKNTDIDFKNIEKNGLTYKTFYPVLDRVRTKTKKNRIDDALNELSISKKAIEYFGNIFIETEKYYSEGGVNNKIKFSKKHFDELKRYLNDNRA